MYKEGSYNDGQEHSQEQFSKGYATGIRDRWVSLDQAKGLGAKSLSKGVSGYRLIIQKRN